MSPSINRRSPMRHGSSDRSESPVRRGSPPRRRRESSPDRHRSSPRKISLVRTNSSHRGRSPTREKSSNRGRSPKHRRSVSVSPASRSPSPRTKRLKRAQAEIEADRLIDRERERTSVRESDSGRHRESDSGRHRERGVDREVPSDRDRGVDKEIPSERSDRNERRSTRDNEKGSSRSRHGRSTSPTDRGRRNKHSSRSPPRARARHEVANPRGSEQSRGDNDDSVAKMEATEEALQAKEKQKPSFELSGKLAAETNRVRGITLLFSEPPDARKPDIRWRLYVFKAGEALNEPLYVHRQSCYLFGRERRVADIPTDHPSCSKQHAVIQFRQVEKEQPDGTLSKQVRPYLMDLGSTNGTFMNDIRIEPQRYYELFEKDTIKFGNSSREYVILHENSAE